MHTKKTALILTLLALNSCHATLQNPNKTDCLCQDYHNMSEEGTASLISGFCREAYQAAQKPIESQTRTATTMPGELIDVIRRMIFGPFLYKKSEGQNMCTLLKVLNNVLVIGFYDKDITIYDQNGELKKSIEIPKGYLRSTFMSDGFLFLGLEINNTPIIKVLDTEKDFSECPTIKFDEGMERPCIQFDPEKKIIFSTSFKTIHLHSIANFRATEKLRKIRTITGEACFIVLTNGWIITGDLLGRIEAYSREKPYRSDIIAKHKSKRQVSSLVCSGNLLFCSWQGCQEVAVFTFNKKNTVPQLVTCIGESEITDSKIFSSKGESVLWPSRAVSDLFFDDQKKHLFVARLNATIDIYHGDHFKQCKGIANEVKPIFTMRLRVPSELAPICFSIDPLSKIIAYCPEYRESIEGVNILFR